MIYKVIITAHRQDYLERLPSEEYVFNLHATDINSAAEWADEKASEIEYGPDKHVEFCDIKILNPAEEK